MFNAKNYTEPKGGAQKILNPGSHYCRIVDIQMDKPPYNKDAYTIMVTLEGPELGDDFVGAPIDKMNPSLGNYRGQIARVKSKNYPFSDYVYNGKDIKRDDQIYSWITSLAKQMGKLDEIIAASGESGFNTIEEYVMFIRKHLTNPELYGMFTIGGEEYENGEYTNYRLFFPKPENKKYPFVVCGEQDETPASFLEFDKVKHIVLQKEKKAAEPVSGFDGAAVSAGHPVDNGLSLP